MEVGDLLLAFGATLLRGVLQGTGLCLCSSQLLLCFFVVTHSSLRCTLLVCHLHPKGGDESLLTVEQLHAILGFLFAASLLGRYDFNLLQRAHAIQPEGIGLLLEGLLEDFSLGLCDLGLLLLRTQGGCATLAQTLYRGLLICQGCSELRHLLLPAGHLSLGLSNLLDDGGLASAKGLPIHRWLTRQPDLSLLCSLANIRQLRLQSSAAGLCRLLCGQRPHGVLGGRCSLRLLPLGIFVGFLDLSTGNPHQLLGLDPSVLLLLHVPLGRLLRALQGGQSKLHVLKLLLVKL
mmetsp:Transcript_43044/g.100257  ORF Transcript_43044/g.100257 Transcript_43044/m.100257 type:complete len:291 (+) Transcript_43044:835-1707(+)